MKYRLKKDILSPVHILAGTIGNSISESVVVFKGINRNEIHFHKEEIENNPEWFEKVENEKIEVNIVEALGTTTLVKNGTRFCYFFDLNKPIPNRDIMFPKIKSAIEDIVNSVTTVKGLLCKHKNSEGTTYWVDGEQLFTKDQLFSFAKFCIPKTASKSYQRDAPDVFFSGWLSEIQNQKQ